MAHNPPDLKEKIGHAKDNPALSKAIENNIRAIIHLRTKSTHERSKG